ncbi:hypothetical protein BTH41_01042 [Bacillus mycoides]|nr:hypothetical protein BTH41_01042 [Bacillus mycoides]
MVRESFLSLRWCFFMFTYWVEKELFSLICKKKIYMIG